MEMEMDGDESGGARNHDFVPCIRHQPSHIYAIQFWTAREVSILITSASTHCHPHLHPHLNGAPSSIQNQPLFLTGMLHPSLQMRTYSGHQTQTRVIL